MILSYNMNGGQTVLQNIPLYSAGTSIAAGAIVIKGATSGTNIGFGIIGTSGFAGVLGLVTTKDSLGSGLDSKQDGTAYTEFEVIINPDAVYMAQYTTPTVSNIATTSATTTNVSITSFESGIGGGWLWGSDNQLQYLNTSSSSGATLNNTPVPAWTTATVFTKILPRFWTLGAFNTAATQIQPAAGAGSAKVVFTENYIQATSIPLQRMNPVKHSGIVVNASLAIFSEVIFRDHAYSVDNY